MNNHEIEISLVENNLAEDRAAAVQVMTSLIHDLTALREKLAQGKPAEPAGICAGKGAQLDTLLAQIRTTEKLLPRLS